MQVNILDAKSQLSRLVKAALAGEEVMIASYGKAQVRLVTCTTALGLKRPGILADASPELLAAPMDAAFSEAVDQQLMRPRRRQTGTGLGTTCPCIASE